MIKEKKRDSQNFYDGWVREELLEDEALTPEEEAFMRGYDEAG